MGDHMAGLPTEAEAMNVAIVGAGTIGVAWAITFARAGHEVTVHDVDAQRLPLALADIERSAAELREFGLLDDDALPVRTSAELTDAVAAADYVQECAVESADVKRTLFASLDELCDPDVVLASSTSMIPCSRFAADLPGRDRCLVVHPGNPPYLLPIAELAPAPFTAPATVRRARAILESAGMVPVLVGKENEGFVFNRLQGALLREAYSLVRDGVATPTDIDRVVTEGLGRRWSVVGPFATAELNTRGGIERHAELLGPAYARMGAERGANDRWAPELVAEVAADVHRRLPPQQWTASVDRRNRAMMLLAQARSTAPELFAGF